MGLEEIEDLRGIGGILKRARDPTCPPGNDGDNLGGSRNLRGFVWGLNIGNPLP